MLSTVHAIRGQVKGKCSNICSNFYFNNPLSGNIFGFGSGTSKNNGLEFYLHLHPFLFGLPVTVTPRYAGRT